MAKKNYQHNKPKPYLISFGGVRQRDDGNTDVKRIIEGYDPGRSTPHPDMRDFLYRDGEVTDLGPEDFRPLRR